MGCCENLVLKFWRYGDGVLSYLFCMPVRWTPNVGSRLWRSFGVSGQLSPAGNSKSRYCTSMSSIYSEYLGKTFSTLAIAYMGIRSERSMWWHKVLCDQPKAESNLGMK